MTEAELQYRLIYSLVVAGKSAGFAENVMRSFPFKEQSPFDAVRKWTRAGQLGATLRACRTGNYGKLEAALRALLDSGLDLATCSPEELETIHGIGPKTSRFFILWTRPAYRCAALDVHILRWLRGQGYDAPRNTPPASKRYQELEAAFLAEADKRGVTPRELDWQIWEASSGYQDPAAADEPLLAELETE